MSLIFSVGLLPSAAMAWRLIRKARGRSPVGSRVVLWRRAAELASPARQVLNRRAYAVLLTGAVALFVAPLAYAVGNLATWSPPPHATHAVGVWVGLTARGDVLTLRVNRYGTGSLEPADGAAVRGPITISLDGSGLSIRPFTSLLGGGAAAQRAVSRWPASAGLHETMVVDGVEMHRLRKVVPLRVGAPVIAGGGKRPEPRTAGPLDTPISDELR